MNLSNLELTHKVFPSCQILFLNYKVEYFLRCQRIHTNGFINEIKKTTYGFGFLGSLDDYLNNAIKPLYKFVFFIQTSVFIHVVKILRIKKSIKI
ncbi:MAG: hypothetical protein RL037_1731 [Bacteroidota bacterium]|jgi:hypothetical protein